MYQEAPSPGFRPPLTYVPVDSVASGTRSIHPNVCCDAFVCPRRHPRPLNPSPPPAPPPPPAPTQAPDVLAVRVPAAQCDNVFQDSKKCLHINFGTGTCEAFDITNKTNNGPTARCEAGDPPVWCSAEW